ncbi:MAG: MFS transporter [Gammaproteobacteria bacterium PRO9]|nr:MFS transporter [Gammaproteobacteria bacterium PRO9]
MRAASSLLGRLLGRTTEIRPHELQSVVTAFLLFFCVMGGYFAVRPVRETVGTILGAERVSDLFVVTWIVSIGVVPLYGWACTKFRRSAFLPWIYGVVALSLAGTGAVLGADDRNVAVAQFFYVWISVLNLFIVSVFWSFLLELFDSGQVRRLFGVIAAGGTTGALAGPVLTDLIVRWVGNPGILYLGAGMFILAIFFQRALLAVWAAPGDFDLLEASGKDASEGAKLVRGARDKPMGGNPFAGFSLVFKSPYLLGIATFVILLASVNTFLYFEQLRLVSETFTDTAHRTQIFARIDYVVQGLTVLLQLFITGRVASRLGVVVLLTIVPLIMVGGFLGLAAVNTFAVLAVVMVTRRVGEYSFIRPGREMLFSTVDTETKYKAKSLIDVPVYRGGDALSAQVMAALEAGRGSNAAVALLGAGLAALWALNGWWLGRRHDAREAANPAAITTKSA